jgi:H+/Na+-translocating ferredoxin:NAD+ oxidoreductase subunit C
MKLFRIKGGVHPKGYKELSAGEPIKQLPMPPELSLPMHQHIGIAAQPMVEVGQKVAKGQLLGMCAGGVICKSGITAPVHAPTSGLITRIEKQTSPHPSGLPEMMVTIEPDGKDQWGERQSPLNPDATTPEVLGVRIHQSGIVGMGGATFPTAAKLDARRRFVLHTLIINGAECEPYLTADDRLMRERAENVVDGVFILKTILNVPKAIIAIEDNKREAADAMREAAALKKGISIVLVPTGYPMGSEKHLIKVLTGEEVPSGALPADLGILVNNVGTAYATHKAVRFGEPLISRIVTVSGGAIKSPGNYDVLLGTKISWLIEACGGFTCDPEQTLIGGPMMGQPISDLEVPVTKGTNGVLALTKAEVHPGIHRPCIRCGECVAACPCGLEPLELATLVRNEKMEAAADAGLADCISCGACSYVCPSHIPLVQYFNYGKGRLIEMRNEVVHANLLKRLSDERNVRVEKKAADKKAKQEARKKAIAARKKAEEEKNAAEAAANEVDA